MALSDRIRPNCEAAPWVIAEVRELESKLAKAREALEFYAVNLNWYLLENTHSVITDEDLDDLNSDPCLGIKLMGGRRAREALKEIE
jgi:hypothetical protein